MKNNSHLNIQIRYYLKSDYKMLIRLLGEAYNSKIDQKTVENVYLSDTRSIFVAVLENEMIVGCAFAEVKEDFVRPSRILYVTYVAVDKNFMKQGIGRKLFDRIELECRKRQCSAIELTSANYRIGAHKFYEKLGFTEKDTTMFIKEL